jgi:hypothetical protein
MIKKVTLGIVALLCIGFASRLMVLNVEGWGWLLFIAFIAITSMNDKPLISIKKENNDEEPRD